jgi:hypothetical protein
MESHEEVITRTNSVPALAREGDAAGHPSQRVPAPACCHLLANHIRMKEEQ